MDINTLYFRSNTSTCFPIGSVVAYPTMMDYIVHINIIAALLAKYILILVVNSSFNKYIDNLS
jgi:hypothetical protein